MRVMFALVMGVCVGYGVKVDIIWNKTSDVTSTDKACAIAVDTTTDFTVYTAGETDSVSPEPRLIKYNSLGMMQWSNSYPRGSQSSASGVAALFDTVYVAGSSFNGADNDFYLVKCNLLGDTVWTRTYDAGKDERASKVVVDGNNNVYVTGSSSTSTTSGFLTVKYNQYGDTVWTRTYDVSGYDAANDIHLEGYYIYVAGYTKTGSDEDYRLIKYDLDGSLQWNRVFNSGRKDIGYGVAADDIDNVYITGQSYSGPNGDIWTIKCNSTGDSVWTRIFDGGHNDCAYDIDVCQGRIYLTGYSNNGTDNDFITIRYDEDGDTIWSFLYDSGDDDLAQGIVVLGENFYLTGIYDNGVNSDFRTMRCGEKSITLTSPNGFEKWTVGTTQDITWNWMGKIDSVVIEYRNESSLGLDTIAVTPNTGSYQWEIPNTPGNLTKVFISALNDYAEVRDSSNKYFAITLTSTEEKPLSLENSLSVEASNPALVIIRYEIPLHSSASLSVYSPDGRMIRDLTPSISTPKGQLIWNGCDKDGVRLARGVYFVQLRTSQGNVISKSFLLR